MLQELTPVYVENIPETLELGKLYISLRHQVSIHLCACGTCGEHTVLDFFRKGHPMFSNLVERWELIEQDGRVTFEPSIGNWQFPCRSHYWIQNNKVVWA